MRKVVRYIAGQRCVKHLWIAGIVWFAIAVIPVIISSIVYPPPPYLEGGVPPQEVPVFPLDTWQFWLHRYVVDPVTRPIGALPIIYFLITLAARILITAKRLPPEPTITYMN